MRQYEGIVILGTPRSGTTLLRRLLNAHPNIACPGETNLFSACAAFLRSEKIAGGAEIGTLSGLEFAGFQRSEVVERLRNFAFQFLREYAARQNKPRWAEKTAFNAFYLKEIEELCGDHVQYVVIRRHGFDVAASLNELCQKNGGYLAELHRYVQRYPGIYEAFAHVWVDLTQELLAFTERRGAVSIRYEDLVSQPESTLNSLLAALGLDPIPDLQAALRDRSAVGLGDWKTYSRDDVGTESVERWRQLPRQTVAAMAEICNPTLEAAGYAAVQVAAPTEVSSQRAYELGVLLGKLKREAT